MNICIISRELYPFYKAGIGVYIYNLALSLAENNHNVVIITDNYPEINNFFMHENIEIVSVEEDNPDHLEFFREYALYYSFKVNQKLLNVVEIQKFDLIEIPDYFGEGYYILKFKHELNKYQDIPICMKIHTPTYECLEANGESVYQNKVIIDLEDYCIKNADVLYCISNLLREKIKNRIHLTKKIDIVYNPIGYLFNRREINSLENSIEKNILFVGRFQKLKGVDLFIDAALKLLDQYKNVTFTLIGNDMINPETNRSVKQELVNSIPEEKMKKINFLNPMSQERLSEFYAKAYVSVFPSRFEGFGNVCLEAIYHGCPVIVSDSGGMMEIIENGLSGLYFESGNVESLVEQIKQIIDNEGLRNSFCNKALERANYFSNSHFYKRQMDFYNNAINDYIRPINNNVHSDFKLWLYGFNKFIQRIDELKIDKEELYSELNRVLQEWEKLRNESGSLTKENERIINEWEKLKEGNSYLFKENERIIKEWEKLRSENEILRNENYRVTSEWESASNCCEMLQANYNTLLNEKENLDYLISKGEKEINTLRKKIEEMEKNLSNKKWLLKQIISRKGDN